VRFLASSKVDSKRRVRIPNGVRDALGIKEGDSVRWFILSSKIAGLMVESNEEEEETKQILEFLTNLSSKKIERTGKPDYRPVSKSDLWLGVKED